MNSGKRSGIGGDTVQVRAENGRRRNGSATVPPVRDYFKKSGAVGNTPERVLIGRNHVRDGRTARYASERMGSNRNLMPIAKGLGAGYQAMGRRWSATRSTTHHSVTAPFLPARAHVHRPRGRLAAAAQKSSGSSADESARRMVQEEASRLRGCSARVSAQSSVVIGRSVAGACLSAVNWCRIGHRGRQPSSKQSTRRDKEAKAMKRGLMVYRWAGQWRAVARTRASGDHVHIATGLANRQSAHALPSHRGGIDRNRCTTRTHGRALR